MNKQPFNHLGRSHITARLDGADIRLRVQIVSTGDTIETSLDPGQVVLLVNRLVQLFGQQHEVQRQQLSKWVNNG